MTDDKTRKEFDAWWASVSNEAYTEDERQAAMAGWQAAKERYGQATPKQGWVQHQFWIDSDGNKHNGLHPSLIGMAAAKEQKQS